MRLAQLFFFLLFIFSFSLFFLAFLFIVFSFFLFAFLFNFLIFSRLFTFGQVKVNLATLKVATMKIWEVTQPVQGSKDAMGPVGPTCVTAAHLSHRAGQPEPWNHQK